MATLDLSGITILAMRAIWEQRPLIERAKACGAKVVAIDVDENAEGLAVADESVVVSELRDLSACFDAAIEYEVDAVVSDECDYSLFATSYIGDRLGLPSVSLGIAQQVTNKRRMRLAVGGAVSQPEYRAVTTLAGARSAVAEIGYPCILKPVDNRGGFGVTKVDGPADVDDAFYTALANAHAREILVESFVEGIPVTVDGYCVDGEHHSLAVASKNTPMGSLYPNLEITYPAELPDKKFKAAMAVNDTVADNLGIEIGATHAEYIVADGEPHLLEFQNRGGGVHTSARIVPAVTGFDVSTQLLADATDLRTGQEGEDFPMERAAVMRFLDFDPGLIRRIDNADLIRGLDGVLTFRLYFEEGDEIKDFSTFTDSHGVIIASGDSPQDAKRTIDQALTEFSITYG